MRQSIARIRDDRTVLQHGERRGVAGLSINHCHRTEVAMGVKSRAHNITAQMKMEKRQHTARRPEFRCQHHQPKDEAQLIVPSP